MAVGSAFAAMNTMYAAVARRSREIGTLRVLGFSKGSILFSFFLESVLLSALGGVLGCLLVLPLNGITTGIGNSNFSETAFNFHVSPADHDGRDRVRRDSGRGRRTVSGEQCGAKRNPHGAAGRSNGGRLRRPGLLWMTELKNLQIDRTKRRSAEPSKWATRWIIAGVVILLLLGAWRFAAEKFNRGAGGGSAARAIASARAARPRA